MEWIFGMEISFFSSRALFFGKPMRFRKPGFHKAGVLSREVCLEGLVD